jgi:hypothetical protein
MSDGATQAAGNGDGQQQGGEQQGQDFSGLTQQLEGLTSSHEETRGALQQISDWIQQQQGGEEQQQGEPELDLSFLENEAMFADPEQLQRNLAQTLESAVDERVKAALGPVQQAQAEARMEQQARDLVAEYPELGQREVAEQVVGLARDIADQNFPAEVAQVLKDSPAWWRQVFLAGRGVEAANAEGGESPATAVLEGGGGAAPAGGSQAQGSYFGLDGESGRARLPFG